MNEESIPSELKSRSDEEIGKLLKPSKPDAVPVVFASDDKFSKYTSVAIESIIQNSSAKNYYDIFILTEDISEENQRKINSQIAQKPNFSIKFFNMKEILEKYSFSASIVLSHIKKPAYYRLFMASVFKNFKKVIYLDGDLILNTDIQELYNIDLEEFPVAAVKDFFISSKQDSKTQKNFQAYAKETLKIDDVANYFNSGVLLVNIQKLLEMNIEKELIRVAGINNKFFHDQNVLNSVFYKNVKIINKFWNYQKFESRLSDEENVKIFHYCNKYKPWNSKKVKFSDHFWTCSKNSPFFDEIKDIFEFKTKKFNFNDTRLNYIIKVNSLKISACLAVNKKTKEKFRKRLESLTIDNGDYK